MVPALSISVRSTTLPHHLDFTFNGRRTEAAGCAGRPDFLPALPSLRTSSGIYCHIRRWLQRGLSVICQEKQRRNAVDLRLSEITALLPFWPKTGWRRQLWMFSNKSGCFLRQLRYPSGNVPTDAVDYSPPVGGKGYLITANEGHAGITKVIYRRVSGERIRRWC